MPSCLLASLCTCPSTLGIFISLSSLPPSLPFFLHLSRVSTYVFALSRSKRCTIRYPFTILYGTFSSWSRACCTGSRFSTTRCITKCPSRRFRFFRRSPLLRRRRRRQRQQQQQPVRHEGGRRAWCFVMWTDFRLIVGARLVFFASSWEKKFSFLPRCKPSLFLER